MYQNNNYPTIQEQGQFNPNIPAQYPPNSGNYGLGVQGMSQPLLSSNPTFVQPTQNYSPHLIPNHGRQNVVVVNGANSGSGNLNTPGPCMNTLKVTTKHPTFLVCQNCQFRDNTRVELEWNVIKLIITIVISAVFLFIPLLCFCNEGIKDAKHFCRRCGYHIANSCNRNG